MRIVFVDAEVVTVENLDGRGCMVKPGDADMNICFLKFQVVYIVDTVRETRRNPQVLFTGF